MQIAVRNIILSSVPPIDRSTGWLNPIKGKVLELRFYLNGAWRVVSDVAASELAGTVITSITTEVNEPLVLEVETVNGAATIKGKVNISEIPVEEIDKLFN